MSELKVYVKPLKTNMFGKTIVGQSYYLKSEADKVIAEKDKQIAELKEQYKDMDVAHTVHIAEMNAKLEEQESEIAELKEKLRDHCIHCPVKEQEDDVVAELKAKLDKAIAERDGNQVCIDALKAKLEDAQASAYAESVDAGMRERRLNRSLWLARAERAKEMCRRLLIQGFDPRWEEVERKCRAKAEEYK